MRESDGQWQPATANSYKNNFARSLAKQSRQPVHARRLWLTGGGGGSPVVLRAVHYHSLTRQVLVLCEPDALALAFAMY